MNGVLIGVQGVVIAAIPKVVKTILSIGIELVLAFALCFGVVKLIGAAMNRDSDPEGPKRELIKLGWIICGSGIVYFLATQAGMSSIAVDPFNQGK